MDPEDELLLARIPRTRRADEGIPEPEVVDDRIRAAHLAQSLLGGFVLPGGLRWSPLGAGWSTDLDLHCHTWPDDQRMADAGWLPLDGLLRGLGHRVRGRWAITQQGHVLAALDLHDRPPGDPADRVLARCRRQGVVRMREVLEFRELHRRGQLVHLHDPVLQWAAAREAEFGGDLLAAWRGPGASGDARARDHLHHGTVTAVLRDVRRHLGAIRRRFRPRVVVALSGVDGSGKSTLAARVVADLQRAGVPARRIWYRPGMGTIEGVAGVTKRLFGVDTAPGVRQVARADAPRPRSRRGLLGWCWGMTVTLAYLWDVRVAHHRAPGVVVYDRHCSDALVTLEFVYSRSREGLHHRLVRCLLPRADLEYYLEVDAPLAVSRKKDPIFGPYAVEEQLRAYTGVLAAESSVQSLDARRSVDDLAAQVLHDLTEHFSQP